MTLQRPPGPQTNTLSRLLAEILPFTQPEEADFRQMIVDITHEYGDIAYWRFWPYNIYLISNPDLIHEVLVSKAKSFHKSPFYKTMLGKFMGDGLVVSDGEFWKRQRRLSQPAFHHKRIEAYATVMVDYTLAMLDQWQDNATYDIDHEMMRLTLSIVSKTLFDADVSGEETEVADALMVLQQISTEQGGALLPIPDWIPTPANRKRQGAIDALDRIVMRFITERRTSGQDTGDLLSMLLAATEEDGSGMTDKQVRDEAVTLFLAGHETTANALNWTWYLLAQHPEIEAALHAELDTVLAGRAPTFADLPALPYTHQVIKEAMRLYPPVWQLGRQAIEDVQIGQWTVPRDTLIFITPYVVHRDARWFEAPDSFRPERWTPEFEQQLPRYAYFPFGGGPRICIGNSFAMMEAALLLATIAQRYRLTLEPGQTIEPEALITLRPRYGIRVRTQARQAAPAPNPYHSRQPMPNTEQ